MQVKALHALLVSMQSRQTTTAICSCLLARTPPARGVLSRQDVLEAVQHLALRGAQLPYIIEPVSLHRHHCCRGRSALLAAWDDGRVGYVQLVVQVQAVDSATPLLPHLHPPQTPARWPSRSKWGSSAQAELWMAAWHALAAASHWTSLHMRSSSWSSWDSR